MNAYNLMQANFKHATFHENKCFQNVKCSTKHLTCNRIQIRNLKHKD